MKNWLKHLGVFALFIALVLVFFKPCLLDNKVLRQGDIEKFEGMSKEVKDFQQSSGESTTWTGSMFSGMPSYTITSPAGPKDYLSGTVHAVFDAFGDQTGAIVLLSLVMMYILLASMGYGIAISVFGAIAYAFSSYTLIIIGAGHVTKGWAMAFMPLVILGMMLIFKKKWIVGFLVFSVALSLELCSNHIQITYYLLILCLFLGVGHLVSVVKEKDFSSVMPTIATLVGAFAVALIINSGRLYANYEQGDVSLRSPSRLSSHVDGKDESIKSDGLDMDYAFKWSYGGAELLTLIVPDAFGGESGAVLDSKTSELAKAYRNNGYQVPEVLRASTYWGEQPFTSGPVYLGAIVCFLALLAFFIVENKYKWWIVAGTVVAIIMSMGANAIGVNSILFHCLPMYNKFRTPSMALVIPQLTFAVLACMALKTINDGKMAEKELLKNVYIAAGITAGLCAIVWLFPSLLLSFSSASDAKMGYPDWYLSALMGDREVLASSDAFRSLVFIAVSFVLVFLACKKTLEDKKTYFIAGVAILCLFDLWYVDRRYLNNDNFTRKVEVDNYPLTTSDQAILADKDLSFRVLTLNNPFNDTHISYYHKSIGGYSAAKLRDYQDLIDQHIEPEMQTLRNSLSGIRRQSQLDSIFLSSPVLNMLNMRYFVVNEANVPLKNKYACGNAWFVDKVVVAKDTILGDKQYNESDIEISMLGSVDLKKSAVVAKSFANSLSATSFTRDESSIKLTSYAPNKLEYECDAKSNQLAVFSEIYYPREWVAYIDGKVAPHFRADWTLRAMEVPTGKHTIVFKCEASTYNSLRSVGSICSVLLLISMFAYPAFLYLRKRKNEAGKNN
ncbi:MAG: YfhO family protein [Paludibacteraceae bacterium]|nr:YfhO family protein [Paludibacteraceae bacterium]